MEIVRKSNMVVCFVLILLSVSSLAGSAYFTVVKLPEYKAEATARGDLFAHRKYKRPPSTMEQAIERKDPGYNVLLLMIVIAATIAALWFVRELLRRGRSPFPKMLKKGRISEADLDKPHKQRFRLTFFEIKCINAVLAAAFVSAALIGWYAWYLSIN